SSGSSAPRAVRRGLSTVCGRSAAVDEEFQPERTLSVAHPVSAYRRKMNTATLNQGTILIVDDTPTNLAILVDYLAERGFDISVAMDGLSAIEQISDTHPDLILLDVRMPGIDGFETCRRLKAQKDTSHLPVIFMTALSDTEDKVKGFEGGAVDYVTKPIQQEEVLARFTTHLTLRRRQVSLEENNALLQQEILERKRAANALRAANDQLERQALELK